MHVTTINEEEDVGMKESEEGRKGRKKCYTEITISKKTTKSIFNVRSLLFIYGIGYQFSFFFEFCAIK